MYESFFDYNHSDSKYLPLLTRQVEIPVVFYGDTTWYGHSCNAWRLFQDGDGGDLRGFLIKSLNFDNIPASVFKKGSRKKSDVSISPLVS